MNNQTLTGIKDTIAFLTARLNDDREAADAVLVDEGTAARIILGMADLNIAMLTMLGEMLGSTAEHMLQTMGRLAGWVDNG